MLNKLRGEQEGDGGKCRININVNMYEREVIVAYMVADDDSPIKVKLWHY